MKSRRGHMWPKNRGREMSKAAFVGEHFNGVGKQVGLLVGEIDGSTGEAARITAEWVIGRRGPGEDRLSRRPSDKEGDWVAGD